MVIRYLDSQKRPIADAVVSIAKAPGSIRDIAMVTDESGAVSVDVTEQGDYVFSVFHNGTAHQVSATLGQEDTELALVVA